MTRRSLLGTIVAASLAGCRPRRSRRPTIASADLASIDRALVGERSLLARYDEAIAQLDAVAATPLTRARERHAAHLRALTDARLHPTPTGTPASTPPPTGSVDQKLLETDLAASAAELRATAVRTRSGQLAGLLAAVAAEHEADAAAQGATS